MTTIIGIVATDNKGVILASDTQYNKFEGKELTTKTEQPKIILSPQQGWAAAGDGSSDQVVDSFERFLRGDYKYSTLLQKITGQAHKTIFSRKSGEKQFTYVTDPRYHPPRQVRHAIRGIIDDPGKMSEIEKILRLLDPTKKEDPQRRDDTIDGYFRNLLDSLAAPQLDPVNEAIFCGYFHALALLNSRTIDSDSDLQPNTYIIAANQPIPKLYLANAYGIMKEVTGDGIIFEVTGSGHQMVLNYFNEETYQEDPFFHSLIETDAKIDASNITIKTAKALAIAAMKRAMRDANTGGLIDYAIITPKGVHSRGDAIRKQYQEREAEILRQEVKLNHDEGQFEQ